MPDPNLPAEPDAGAAIDAAAQAFAPIEIAAAAPSIVASDPVAPRLRFAGIVAVFVAAVLLCLLAYLVVAVPASWFPSATTRAWSAKDLTVARGTGALVGDELVVTHADATGNTLVTLTSDIRSGDFAAIAWIAIDLPEGAAAHLFWRNEYQPNKLNSVPVAIESGRTLPVVLAGNADWIGRVTGLALAVRGTLAKPIRIRGVVAKPMGAVEVMRDRAGEWFAFEGWTGTSINTVIGGADVQDLPLPMLLVVATLITVGVVLLWSWLRRGAARVPLVAVVMGTFIGAWFLLDLRWTWNLARQVTATADTFAGKDVREKYLATVDGPLYPFIEKVRAALPREPARIWVVSDAAYFRNRSAYHLYPHNVYSEPISNAIPPAALMRTGDWLVVVQRRGIQFDAALQRLKWDGDQNIAAELKLVEPGYALFRIL